MSGSNPVHILNILVIHLWLPRLGWDRTLRTLFPCYRLSPGLCNQRGFAHHHPAFLFQRQNCYLVHLDKQSNEPLFHCKNSLYIGHVLVLPILKLGVLLTVFTLVRLPRIPGTIHCVSLTETEEKYHFSPQLRVEGQVKFSSF